MRDPKLASARPSTAAELEMRRLTRRSSLVGGAAALAGLGAWRWLTRATPEDGVPWPLRVPSFSPLHNTVSSGDPN